MVDTSIATNAWRIFIELLPALSMRLALGLGLWLGFMVSLVAGAVAGRALSSFPYSHGGMGAAMAAFFFAAFLISQRYRLFYSFTFAQFSDTAAIFHYSKSQFAKNSVDGSAPKRMHLFDDAVALAEFDRLMSKALKSCVNMMGGLSAYQQFPGFTGLVALAGLVLRQATADLRVALYIYLLRASKGNPWETLRQGLVLYMQNAIRLTRSAFFYWFLAWVAALILFFVLRAPIRGLFTLFPAETYSFADLATLALVISLKTTLIDTFVGIAFSDLFDKVTSDDVPDPAWERRLTDESPAFKQIKENALQRFGFLF